MHASSWPAGGHGSTYDRPTPAGGTTTYGTAADGEGETTIQSKRCVPCAGRACTQQRADRACMHDSDENYIVRSRGELNDDEGLLYILMGARRSKRGVGWSGRRSPIRCMREWSIVRVGRPEAEGIMVVVVHVSIERSLALDLLPLVLIGFDRRFDPSYVVVFVYRSSIVGVIRRAWWRVVVDL